MPPERKRGRKRRRRRRAAVRAGGVDPGRAPAGGGASEDPAGGRPSEEPRASTDEQFMARYRARSEARNQAAREALVPLREGERPRAVTVAAVVAFLLALGNLIAYAAGVEIGGERPPVVQVVSQALLMLIAGWGMWRGRYWAVLGMQMILALLILLFSALLITATNLAAVLVAVAVIAAAGTLFWFLVKALARIQMPERAA